jgi:TPR repeat protein
MTLQEAHKLYNEKRYEEAFVAYERLAYEGNADAQTSLGYMYQQGQGVAKDEKKAIEWYEKAIEQEQPYALFNLGLMYANSSRYIAQDIEKAHALFLRSAVAGVDLAQYEVALMFEQGAGCNQNYSEAAYWYEEAAKRGHKEAFNNLGVLYKEGRGVPQNFKRAFVCFSRAAEAGLSAAQYNLGMLYDRGEGVEEDHEKALEWCRKAAFQGHAKAKQIISGLQEQGKIVF